MEFGDVATRKLVPRGYAHRPRFAVQPAFEPQRPGASADVARIGFEDGDAMSPALELVGGDESGEPGADDDDMQRRGVRRGSKRRERGIGSRRAGKRGQPAQEF